MTYVIGHLRKKKKKKLQIAQHAVATVFSDSVRNTNKPAL